MPTTSCSGVASGISRSPPSICEPQPTAAHRRPRSHLLRACNGWLALVAGPPVGLTRCVPVSVLFEEHDDLHGISRSASRSRRLRSAKPLTESTLLGD